MDNIDSRQFEPKEPVLLNQEALKALSETRKWTNFFSILGIVCIGLFLAAAVIMAVVLPSLNEEAGQDYSPVFIGILYLVFGALYLLPIIYLFRFGSMMRKAISTSSDQLMGAAFKYLSLHFRTIGIITIVIIALYILAIILMLVFGMGMFAENLIGAWKEFRTNLIAFYRWIGVDADSYRFFNFADISYEIKMKPDSW